MIDRKTLAIGCSFLVLLLGMIWWRMSQLPDWTQLPRYSDDGAALSPLPIWRLLSAPLGIVFCLVLFAVKGWMRNASEEELKPWRKRRAMSMLLVGMMLSLTQAVIIAHSFPGPLFSVARALHSLMIFFGVCMIILSNTVPKLPWLSMRSRALSLNPEYGARLLRFSGYSGVTMGLVFITLGLLSAPPVVVSRIVMTLALGIVALSILFWIQLKRRQSQQ